MLLATSNGLTSPALLGAAKDLIAPHFKRAAILTTASCHKKSKDWHIPTYTEHLRGLGLTATPFDLDDGEPRALLSYDVLMILGGNPFYLLRAIHEQNAVAIFETFYDTRLIIGCSTGSMVLGPTLGLAELLEPAWNEDVGLPDTAALHLCDMEFLPHYGKLLTRYERLDDRLAGYVRQTGRRVRKLNDREAILIVGDISQRIS